jgi:hypothetical protein
MSPARSRSISGVSSTSLPTSTRLALVEPGDRGIVDGVAVIGDHHYQAKGDLPS